MEEWRPVPGFEKVYEVSDTGRIASIDRYVRCADGDLRLYRGKLLKPNMAHGYLRATLQHAGSRVRMCVHVIVASAFHGPKPDGCFVLHRDDVKTNNRADNLYYGTIFDNAADAIRNCKQHHGSQIRQSKLREKDIPDILRLRESGQTYREIGKRFGVTPQAIFHVCKGKWWKRLMPPDQRAIARNIIPLPIPRDWSDQMMRAGAPVPPRRA